LSNLRLGSTWEEAYGMRHEYPRVAWDQDFTVLNMVQGFYLWYRKGATAHTIRFQGTKGVRGFGAV